MVELRKHEEISQDHSRPFRNRAIPIQVGRQVCLGGSSCILGLSAKGRQSEKKIKTEKTLFDGRSKFCNIISVPNLATF